MATATLERLEAPQTAQTAQTAQAAYVRGSHVSRKRGRKVAEIRATVERRRLQMLAWRAMGYDLASIAEAAGVGVSYVCQELKRAGYVPVNRNLPPLPTYRG